MARGKLKRGLVQVYTGDGKGKTSAALGVTFRALGWGLRVCVVQFIKGYLETGEMKMAERFPSQYVIRQFATDPSCYIDETKAKQRKEECEQAMAYAEEVVNSGEFDLVVLDEINNAMGYKLLDIDRVLDLIHSKPKHVELILTGRRAPKEIIDAADLATDMRLIKHPFEKRISARAGVDY
ncbi:MAG: cob(I)yrinic acid a,c-diamide adenosyltransferase [Armatimonadota bacterium]|nr:cob(I)yrinic acid a,c-diamide adenosyltransferase [Armatimonadota bacterium]